jgi:Calcineurin-like phosphoesterase
VAIRCGENEQTESATKGKMILQGKGLIVPDSHEQYAKLVRVLAEYEPQVDWVLFLGDFLDTFDGLTENTHLICKWLMENVANPKYHFLWGNHDIHYAFPWDDLKCSGWTGAKRKVVAGYLDHSHWKHFRCIAWIEGDKTKPGPREWLCTHAGIHEYMLHPVHGYDREALFDMEEIVLSDLQFAKVHPWLQAGRGRGGNARVGGVDWLDWNSEFAPIPGLNQIVGHTHGSIPRIKETSDSFNICIDDGLKHVILIEDGKIELKGVV